MSKPKFLRATLLNEEQVVSEFHGLAGSGQGYSGQVFATEKPFNCWQVVSGAHSVSGEPCLVRTRMMINGVQIRSIQQVQPTCENHQYLPANFEAVQELQHGEFGSWVAPAGIPNAVEGTEYPVHRENTELRRYVILQYHGGEGDVVHFIDPLTEPGETPAAPATPLLNPGDSDFDV